MTHTCQRLSIPGSVLAAALIALPARAATQGAPAATSPGAGPVIVVETAKGTFEFETYPNEAPKTVARIVELVQKRFYNGQRVHRVERDFVVQLGDPTTRDMTKEAEWGRLGSGTPIGVAEITKTRTHVLGAVAMAHAGDPAKADSQFYITLSPQPSLNGKYTVFGKVISGMDVVNKLAVTDRIIRITVRGAT
jgi:cyclophilin family peptidyl-prolyl cis-trans isomerase